MSASGFPDKKLLIQLPSVPCRFVKLTIVGSGTGVPREDRGSPAYLLAFAASRVLVDSGPGTLRQLACAGVSINDITHIFYTHCHPDHTLDFGAFLFASKSLALLRHKNLTVVGPKGFLEFYEKWKNLYGTWIQPDTYKLEILEMLNSEKSFDDFTVQSKEMVHIYFSVGYRFTEHGRSVVLSGDTDYHEGIVELGKGADILLLECSLPDDMRCPGHLTPALCGRIAREANPKKLVLSHFYPTCDKTDIKTAVSKEWDGEIALATDFMEFVV